MTQRLVQAGSDCLNKPPRSREAAALDIARQALQDVRFVSHTAHWDKTGGAGRGCPACLEQRETYEKIQRALRDIDTLLGK